MLDLQSLKESFPVTLAEALALVAGMPAGVDEYEQMMWLLKRFTDDKASAELFEERFQAAQSAYETLAPDPVLLPHLDDYRRLVRLRALWRHGARLDSGDGDFDVSEYRPQTYALVREAVSVERLRDDLPIYRIDGSYLKRLDEAPGSPEEKAAEIEAAIEYEIRKRGGEKDPVARSLAERLERMRQRKESAQQDMLELLEELVREVVTENEAHEALGLSDRGQGFLSLARTRRPGGDRRRDAGRAGPRARRHRRQERCLPAVGRARRRPPRHSSADARVDHRQEGASAAALDRLRRRGADSGHRTRGRLGMSANSSTVAPAATYRRGVKRPVLRDRAPRPFRSRRPSSRSSASASPTGPGRRGSSSGPVGRSKSSSRAGPRTRPSTTSSRRSAVGSRPRSCRPKPSPLARRSSGSSGRESSGWRRGGAAREARTAFARWRASATGDSSSAAPKTASPARSNAGIGGRRGVASRKSSPTKHARLQLRYSSLGIRDPKTRWGSCSRRGHLSFSWRLAAAPPAVLEYVVVHELCHLKEPSHAKPFWRLLDPARPGWQEQARWLREHGQELHDYDPSSLRLLMRRTRQLQRWVAAAPHTMRPMCPW